MISLKCYTKKHLFLGTNSFCVWCPLLSATPPAHFWALQYSQKSLKGGFAKGGSLFSKMKFVSLIRIWCMLRQARHVSCISRMTYDNWSPSWSEHCPFQDTGLTNPIFQHWHVQLQLAKWQAIESPSLHTQWTRTRCLDWRFHTT